EAPGNMLVELSARRHALSHPAFFLLSWVPCGQFRRWTVQFDPHGKRFKSPVQSRRPEATFESRFFMCGIVGLLIKKPSLRSSLGELVTPMLTCMGERGSDSAGLAVFSDHPADSLRRFSLYSPAA